MNGLHRVVFDTSTLVSAALRVGSVPHEAFAHAVSAGEVCISQATLAELEHVLLRPKFDKYHPWRGIPIMTPRDYLLSNT